MLLFTPILSEGPNYRPLTIHSPTLSLFTSNGKFLEFDRYFSPFNVNKRVKVICSPQASSFMTNPPYEAKEAERADEARLIRISARGDAFAFTWLYQLYRDRVFGFALRMLGDYETAEDVTHEAFVALIEHPERYKPERGSLLTFLCGVARNHILLHWRRRGYQLEDQIEDDWEIAAPSERATNPLNDFLGREQAATVNAAIAALPVLQREALVLREFQELSYAEIASVTSTSVDVIKMRLRRARQSLTSRLSEYLKSEEGPYELQRGTTKSRTCA